MNLALDVHNGIVRDLIGRHSGYECLTEVEMQSCLGLAC